MIGRLLKRAVLIGGVCGVAVSAQAQQRPLVTEDPETIGAGFVLIEAGFDYRRDEQFTVSGLTGTLLRVPAVGLSIGVSSIAEIQLDGLSYSRLVVTDRDVLAPLSGALTFAGETTTSVEDFVIGTKVRLVPGNRPPPGVWLPLCHAPTHGEQRERAGAGHDGLFRHDSGGEDDPIGEDRRKRGPRHPR